MALVRQTPMRGHQSFDDRFDIGANPDFAVCRACRMRCHIDWTPNDHGCDDYAALVAGRWRPWR